jgi:hypothetical protein
MAAFWRYLQAPSMRSAVLVGVLCGATFLSKFSAVLLPPILILTAFASGKWRYARFSHAALAAAVAFFVIWAGYFFEFKPILQNTPDPPKKIAFLNKLGGPGLVRFASEVPVPLATFGSSIVSLGFTRLAGVNAYLNGKWSQEGWWYYYLTAFSIKETIPFLILILAGILLSNRLGLDRTAGAALFIPVIFFFVITMRDKAQAGIRYLLPVFPFLFLIAGGACAYWIRRSRATAVVVLALLSWHAAEAAAIYPDYLAYFNQIAGGPANGYRWLRDSNIDWAQDLKGLGEFVREKGYPEVVLLYHSPEDPHYYRIPYRRIEPREYEKPDAAVYALGVHGIDTVRWFERYKPVAHIGHSIYVYDLRKETL